MGHANKRTVRTHTQTHTLFVGGKVSKVKPSVEIQRAAADTEQGLSVCEKSVTGNSWGAG